MNRIRKRQMIKALELQYGKSTIDHAVDLAKKLNLNFARFVKRTLDILEDLERRVICGTGTKKPRGLFERGSIERLSKSQE